MLAIQVFWITKRKCDNYILGPESKRNMFTILKGILYIMLSLEKLSATLNENSSVLCVVDSFILRAACVYPTAYLFVPSLIN